MSIQGTLPQTATKIAFRSVSSIFFISSHRYHVCVKEACADGPETFELHGDFTNRGVTGQEVLTVTVNGRGTGSG